MEPCLFAWVLGATLDPDNGYFIRQATRQGCLFGDYEGNSSMPKAQWPEESENGCENNPFEERILVSFKRVWPADGHRAVCLVGAPC